MKNQLDFEKFMKNLRHSNRNLKFFVDWDKCLTNKNSINIYLNHLNFLLGSEQKQLKEKIALLFREYPKAFSVLPLLLAIRNKKEIILDSKGLEIPVDAYLQNSEGIYNFILESGLCDIFNNREIKDLNDFIFGIEVGLDSNARKNRGGSFMESYLRDIFTKANLSFKEQVSTKEFNDLHSEFGNDIKKFDFVIFGNKTYFIECNFYVSGGSKLNEVSRAYQKLALKFNKLNNKDFIWITDGCGWFNAKNKLHEAYKNVEIYNLNNLNNLIQKMKN